MIRPFVHRVIPPLSAWVKSLFFHHIWIKVVALIITILMAIVAYQGGKP